MTWDMLGHDWAVEMLRTHIAGQRLRHAYLITGPQGTGRRTLAVRFAQAINCSQPPGPGRPCGTCASCRQFGAMEHPDLSVLRADESSGVIKVDMVRDIQRVLNLSPYQASYRIGLILDFETANPNAANALLKTLEEPPPKVILILTAESAEGLLPTIVSRCEIVRLRPLPLDQVHRGLVERWSADDNLARLLAHVSGGRPGYAIRLMNEPGLMETRQQTFEDLDGLFRASLVDRFGYAQDLSSNREEMAAVLMRWSSIFRDVLLVAADSQSPLTNIDHTDRIRAYAEKIEVSTTYSILHKIEDTLDMLDRYVNPRLAMEILLLDIPNI